MSGWSDKQARHVPLLIRVFPRLEFRCVRPTPNDSYRHRWSSSYQYQYIPNPAQLHSISEGETVSLWVKNTVTKRHNWIIFLILRWWTGYAGFLQRMFVLRLDIDCPGHGGCFDSDTSIDGSAGSKDAVIDHLMVKLMNAAVNAVATISRKHSNTPNSTFTLFPNQHIYSWRRNEQITCKASLFLIYDFLKWVKHFLFFFTNYSDDFSSLLYIVKHSAFWHIFCKKLPYFQI